MVWYCSCTLRLLKLMCANLLYTVYTHALCVLVSVFASVYRIPFFAWLTSVVNNNLLPTACAPLFHSFASLSFSCILLNRHLFSAQIIHSFTLTLFLGLPLSLSLFLPVSICGCAFHLSAFIERSISMWNYFFPNRTMPIACSYLQVPYSTRIMDEFSLIVSVRLVWLSFFLVLCNFSALEWQRSCSENASNGEIERSR